MYPQHLISDNGNIKLQLQSDGDLCLIKLSESNKYWCSQTHGHGEGPYYLLYKYVPADLINIMSNHYELSIIDSKNTKIWSRRRIVRVNNKNGLFRVQSDSNIVFFDGRYRTLWNLNNNYVHSGNYLIDGGILYDREYLKSSNGKYSLRVVDGSLEIYNNEQSITTYSSNARQDNGEYILYLSYDYNPKIYKIRIFNIEGEESLNIERYNTLARHNSGYLIMQDDGNAVLYEEAGGRVLWSAW